MKVNHEKIVEEILEYIDADELRMTVGHIKTSFTGFIGAIGDKKLLVGFRELQVLIGWLEELVDTTVQIIEKISKEMDGFDEDKKKVLVKFLDDQIDLPFYLEWLDDNIIGNLIDEAVEFLNEYGWDEDIEKNKEIKKVD